ncbi:PQQ-binding-like beta-propeller repeat protein [Actinomadura sp. 7K507]|uniref:outer membrane protein assembly factor BamB family protein n=1 Tax=Actinomadura sp. 7K507 TaxID=2530365 RepID=UPI00105295C7|nr:PQQ-binding-like beta-propeller repeat protein [Actinomadura sp. 7K507]TDC94600.1 hypothetical protein E1285_08265 [Actinomadura sp. 7K507]
MSYRRAPVAALAAIAVLAGGCTGTDDEKPPGIEVDRVTTASGTRPAADAGLPARTPQQVWRADLPGLPSPNLARTEFVAGHVAVVSNRGLDVLDAQTGKARWHYYEKARLVLDYAVTSDTVVVTTVATDRDGNARQVQDRRLRTTGLDAAGGRTLWNRGGLRPVTEGQKTGYRPMASPEAGVAVFEGPDKKKPSLVGVDARTGKQRWTWAAGSAERCSFNPQDTDGSLLSVEAACAGRKTMYALDPATGAVKWSKPSRLGTWQARTRGGVTLITAYGVDDVNMSWLVTADGKTIWKLKHEDLAAKEIAVAGDRAVLTVADHGRSRGMRLEFVNVRTGKVSERTDAREHGGLVTAGGRVYGIREWLGEYEDHRYGLSPELTPGALDVIDPGKGEVTTVPLPFALRGEQLDATPRPAVIEGDRLYRVQSPGNGLRITAYGPGGRGGPAETGGVAVADWPDACDLTAKADRVRERKPSPHEPLRLGAVKISNWGCQVRGGAGPFEFRIGWVAPDAGAASELLAGRTVGTEAERSRRFGDEAYVVRNTGGTTLTMRTGRYIVVFSRADLTPGGFNRSVIEAVDKALR